MQKIKAIGSIATFGQHKGSGFSLALAIEGGIFADGSLAHPDQLQGRNAVRLQLTDLKALERRIPREQHDRMMADFVEQIRSMKPLDPEKPVLAPGDPEMNAHRDRTAHGIPLKPGSLDDVRHIADEMKIRDKVELLIGT